MPILITLLLSMLLRAAPPGGSGCALSGTAVDSVTGKPLNKVSLQLEPSLPESATISARTDEQGRFSLSGVRADTAYRLRAKRSGYLETFYGNRGGGTGTLIRLKPDEVLSQLTVRLVAAAVITGTIRDSDGEPVEGAMVNLGRVMLDGESPVESFESTESDDRGEYRFRGLAAGKYYVSAETSAGGADGVRGAATLYHGARDIESATAVSVSAGGVLRGVDISLLPQPQVFRVSGRWVPATPSTTLRGLSIVLRDKQNRGMRTFDLYANLDGSSFEFPAVPQGRYELIAQQNSLWGKQLIDVSSDMENVNVALEPGGEIQFSYLVEGRQQQQQPDFTGAINYYLTSDGRRSFSNFLPGGDRFVARSVPPDRYTVRFFGDILRTMYVKSATAGGVGDVLTEGLHVQGPGRITVNVVLGEDGAKLTGVVRDSEGKPALGAAVLFVPVSNGRAHHHDLDQAMATTDQNGLYELAALAPGEYRAFAWSGDDSGGDWRNPEFRKRHEKSARKVVLGPRSETRLDLQTASRPEEQ